MSSPYSTLDGSRYVTDYFLASNWTRLAWAATFATFVLWGTTWFMRHAFGQADEVAFGPNVGGYGTKRSGVDPELGQTSAGGGPAMTTTDNTNVGTTAGTTGTTAYNEDPARLGGGASTLQNVYNRMQRSHDMLRDLTLMLLFVMVLNSFAKGLTRAAAILTWIYFGFAVIFAVVESLVAHKYARLIYSLVFFGIALAIGGGAFAYGFWY
ncbi:hypothetical protein BGW37DRAFT_481918 [Umbelopsis sp. PMI_123]|nr:hypothetical protein BGW37DRAFT_481918 [Umbelopsis sp. PMI_123]